MFTFSSQLSLLWLAQLLEVFWVHEPATGKENSNPISPSTIVRSNDPTFLQVVTAGKHDWPEIWNCEVRTRKYFLFASRQLDFQNDFRPKRIKMKVCTWYQAHRGILIRLGCFLAILVQMAFLVQNLLWPAHTTTHMEITRWYQNLAMPAKCGKCQQKSGKCQHLCCFSVSLSDLPFPAIFKVIITHYASNYLLPMQNTLFPPLNHLSS